jgi:hypothetical protein
MLIASKQKHEKNASDSIRLKREPGSHENDESK